MMFSPADPPTLMTNRTSGNGTLGRSSSNITGSAATEQQAPLPSPSSQSNSTSPPASSPLPAPTQPVSPPPPTTSPPPPSVPPPPPPISPPPSTPPPRSPPPPPVIVLLSPPPPAATNNPPPSPPPSPPPLNPISTPPPPNNLNQAPPPLNLPPPPNNLNQAPPPPNLPLLKDPPPPPPLLVSPPPPPPLLVSPPPPPPLLVSPPPPPPLLVSPPPMPVVEPVPETPYGIPPPPFPISPPHPSAPMTNPSHPATPLKPPPPPPRHPDSSVSTWSQPSGTNGSSGAVTIAVTVGVVFAVAFVAFIGIFVLVSRKKRRTNGSGSQYSPAPGPFILGADGHYHMKENTAVNSNTSDTYYPSKTPSSPSVLGKSYASFRTPLNQSEFAYEELMEITSGFSPENMIGQGGFGCVYKGCLPNGRPVAVKQLKVGSGQGEREFKAEVEIISRVHHRHLVTLVGYCISEQNRLLVYEFVPNKTLEYHLHENGLPPMEWSKRVKIAIGSARGLAYLHEDCHPRIIHRDIKSANILLDQTFNAQVADFGLAKLTNDAHTHVSTRVVGTFGYMAPEYASSGKLTDRSDVFSFGVVLLELITGRKPVDPSRPLGDESLVEWARPLLVRALEVGDYEELVDPRLEGNFLKNEMLRMIEVATACVRHSAPKRPRMVQVLRALDCEADMADLSNGVKYGQSMAYDSGQYSADIKKFRRMAFGSEEFSSDYGHSKSTFSSDSQIKDTQSNEQLDPGTSREFTSGESKTSHSPANHTKRASYSSEGNEAV